MPWIAYGITQQQLIKCGPQLVVQLAFDRVACQPVCLQYLGDLGCEYVVFKNDEKTVDEIKAMNPAGILVSPGPGKTVML